MHDVNLTAEQHDVITKLQNNTQIVIMPADKGGNVVIMDMHQYDSMCRSLHITYIPRDDSDIQNEFRMIMMAYNEAVLDKETLFEG